MKIEVYNNLQPRTNFKGFCLKNLFKKTSPKLEQITSDVVQIKKKDPEYPKLQEAFMDFWFDGRENYIRNAEYELGKIQEKYPSKKKIEGVEPEHINEYLSKLPIKLSDSRSRDFLKLHFRLMYDEQELDVLQKMTQKTKNENMEYIINEAINTRGRIVVPRPFTPMFIPGVD